MAQMALAPLSIRQLGGKNGINPCMRFGCPANNSETRLVRSGMPILGSHYVSMKN